MKEAFEAAGLYDRRIRPGLHCLRRSYASHSLGAGVDVQTVMETAGLQGRLRRPLRGFALDSLHTPRSWLGTGEGDVPSPRAQHRKISSAHANSPTCTAVRQRLTADRCYVSSSDSPTRKPEAPQIIRRLKSAKD